MCSLASRWLTKDRRNVNMFNTTCRFVVKKINEYLSRLKLYSDKFNCSRLSYGTWHWETELWKSLLTAPCIHEFQYPVARTQQVSNIFFTSCNIIRSRHRANKHNYIFTMSFVWHERMCDGKSKIRNSKISTLWSEIHSACESREFSKHSTTSSNKLLKLFFRSYVYF